MHKIARTIAAVGLLVAAGIGYAEAQSRPPGLHLTSTAFQDGGRIPKPYVCEDSKNFSRRSPAFAWTGAPEGTASFAIIFHDAEVHIRKGADDVLHWMIWNIPGEATGLAENLPLEPQLPDGSRQSKNVTSQLGYMGPCAPQGLPHHYTFDLYALDAMLEVPPEATRADVVKAMDGHIIGKGVLIGLFNQ